MAGSPAAHEVLAGRVFLGGEPDAGQYFQQETANLRIVIDDADAPVRGICIRDLWISGCKGGQGCGVRYSTDDWQSCRE
jgi:hypothetical protein